MKKGVRVVNSSNFVLLLAITILLSALKLTGTISWSWWLVTLPIWGVPAFFLINFLFLLFVMGLVLLADAVWKK